MYVRKQLPNLEQEIKIVIMYNKGGTVHRFILTKKYFVKSTLFWIL